MDQTASQPADYLVTVCGECLCASCWHGEHLCEGAFEAATIEKRASELLELDKEAAWHFSRDRLMEVCGAVQELSA